MMTFAISESESEQRTSNLEYASQKGAEAVKSIMSGERVDIITAGMIEICMEYLAEILDELKAMRKETENGH